MRICTSSRVPNTLHTLARAHYYVRFLESGANVFHSTFRTKYPFRTRFIFQLTCHIIPQRALFAQLCSYRPHSTLSLARELIIRKKATTFVHFAAIKSALFESVQRFVYVCFGCIARCVHTCIEISNAFVSVGILSDVGAVFGLLPFPSTLTRVPLLLLGSESHSMCCACPFPTRSPLPHAPHHFNAFIMICMNFHVRFSVRLAII